jgi:hypothetical protein
MNCKLLESGAQETELRGSEPFDNEIIEHAP